MSRVSTAIAVVILAALGGPARPLVPPADGIGRLPLRFERNDGQAAEPVRYLARGPGYTVLVTPAEIVLFLQTAAPLRVKLLEGRPDAEMEAVGELPGKSNYFIGSDSRKWRRGVPGYAKVRCRGVYPGIDLVYYGRQRQLEYDFVVAPGADPGRIRLGFEGARGLGLDGEGNLVVAAQGGDVVHRAPRIYQKVGASQDVVRGRWVLLGASEARFEVGAYDARRELVIDPVLVYSTYLGGSGQDIGAAIAVDGSGSAYVTGGTRSTDFPTQNPHQAYQADFDAFVAKLSPSGDSLVYSTYLGGGLEDFGRGIAVDGSGAAYVTGYTSSADFPTQNPYQADQGQDDVFVTKLSPSGDSLVYSTYLGGSSLEYGYAIAVDGSGNAYTTGFTSSPDFPTQNAYQIDQGQDDAFVTKLSPSGDSLVYSTYLGGNSADSGFAIAVDGPGSAYVTGNTNSTDFPTQNPYQADQLGYDAFVTKLSPSGDSLVYSTYLGGSLADLGAGIALDGSGSAHITGSTSSADFPTQNPYQTGHPGADAFVTKLSPSGDGLVYSTYLGGSGSDFAYAIALDGFGNAYVTGGTTSADFPTRDPYQTDQASYDAYLAELSPSGNSLVYSTYLGGRLADDLRGGGVAVDGSGSVYVTGDTESPDFPTQNPYQMYWGLDAFIAKLGPPPPTRFFTVSPCRLIDTRNAPGSHGGPALVAGADRTFAVVRQECDISLKARALSVNVAVTQPTASGNLRLYPGGGALPLASTINYTAGQTRSNNAIILLTSRAITVRCTQPSGTAHLILDVNGYFE